MRESRALLSLVLIALLGIALLVLLKPESGSNLADSGIPDPGAGAMQSGSPAISDDSPPQVSGSEDTAGRQPLATADAQITGRLVGPDGPAAAVEIELLRLDKKRVIHSAWQGVTDAEGRFHVNAMPADRYWPIAHGPNLPPDLEFIAFDLKDNQRIDLGNLRVPVPSALHGRVTDALGLPIAGVRVYRIYSSRHTNTRFNLNVSAGHEDADPNVLTDALGRFAFANLPPGRHRILADLEPYVEGKAECSIKQGEDHALPDIQVERGTIALGRVFSIDGNPIQGALVVPLELGDRQNLRRGKRTDVDGNFILSGLDIIASIQVQAKGFAFQDADYSSFGDNKEPLVLKLQPELTLRGHVEGMGTARGTVQIDPADLDTLSPSVQKLCWVPLPIESNGTFVIEGLVQGRYEIIASADASGNRRSEPLSFDMLPDMAPLSLTLAEQKTIEVVVRDDSGQVLVDAEVYAYPRHFFMNKRYTWPTGRDRIASTIAYSQRDGDGGQHLRTDIEGHAFPLEPDESLSIAATHPGHLSAAASFKAGQVPALIELVLPRAARLSGRLDSTIEEGSAHISVAATPLPGQGVGLPETAVVSASVDAQGRYLFDAIHPGRYELALLRSKVASGTAPLLGAGIDTRNARRVELLPEENPEVNLKVAPLGTITGRVLLHGKPAPGIHVFEASHSFGPPKNPISPADIQGRSAFEWRTHTQTDESGRYRFAYAKPGSWHFLVQHPDSPVPGKPIAIQANDYALDLEQDLVLEAAEVRGRIDLLSIPENRRQHLEVFLVSVDLAKNDPFWMGGTIVFDRNESSGQKLENGNFSFRFLRAGDWILRLVDRYDDLLMQLPVHTARNQIMDLGPLAFPPMVDLRLQVELPDPTRSAGVWLRRAFEGDDRLVYARSLFVNDGYLQDGYKQGMMLEPGSYQAELFWAYVPTIHSMRLNGKSAEQFISFEVHADGSTTPSKLDFS